MPVEGDPDVVAEQDLRSLDSIAAGGVHIVVHDEDSSNPWPAIGSWPRRRDSIGRATVTASRSGRPGT